MANYQKAAKVGLASLISYCRSIPPDSFNYNIGVHLSNYSGLEGLMSKLKAQTDSIGSIIKLPRENNRPGEHLYRLLMNNSSSNLKQSMRYKGIMFEAELEELKQLKYVVPIVLNRTSQVVILVKRGSSKPLVGNKHVTELEIRKLVVEIMRVSHSIGNSMELQLTFLTDDYFVLSFNSSNSKKECIANYAQCGYLTISSKSNMLEIVPNYTNTLERLKLIQNETNMLKMELQKPTIEQLFSESDSYILPDQFWGGQLAQTNHIENVLLELMDCQAPNDCQFLNKLIQNIGFVNSIRYRMNVNQDKPGMFSSINSEKQIPYDNYHFQESLFDQGVQKLLPPN